MKKLLSILIVCAWMQQPARGQDAQNAKLDFDIDHASFAHESETADLDVYFSIPLNQFSFIARGAQKVANYAIDIRLTQNDSLVDRRAMRRTSTLPRDKNLAGGEAFLSVAKFTQLQAGAYQCVARVEDLSARIAGEQEFQLDLPDFRRRKIDISDIELANAISRDTTASIYSKGSYRVVPNPRAIYTTANPMVYFYAEIYNRDKSEDASYSLEYRVLREDGSLLRAYPRLNKKRYGAKSAEIGGINVVSFPSGVYELQLNILDSSETVLATALKKFYTLRRKIESAAAAQSKRRVDLLYQDYKTIGLDSLNTEFSSAKHLASKEERSIFKALDLTGKQRFMAEFWARNFDKKNEHERRVKYANEHYSRHKQGWKTDRGRIFVQHGEPDRIDKNISLKERRAFETWRYFHVEGGIIFIFVDKGGFDDLQLVHSTAQTELNDPDWRRWVE